MSGLFYVYIFYVMTFTNFYFIIMKYSFIKVTTMKKFIVFTMCLISCHVFFAKEPEKSTDYKKGKTLQFKNYNGYEEWYDSKNRTLYSVTADGFERWVEYDSNGKELHSKDSLGYETWQKYDTRGNLLSIKDSFGYEDIYKYDSQGNKIYYKEADGYEEWLEYKNGKLIHDKNSKTFENWYQYDEKGNLIYQKTHYYLPENIEEYWYEYDENKNLIHSKNSNGYEEWYKYNQNNILIHLTSTSYKQEIYEYNSNQKLTCKKIANKWGYYDDDGKPEFEEYFYEYDENGNLIHENLPFCREETWYEYDKNNKLIYKKFTVWGNTSEHWYKYDKNGNLINEKDSLNHEIVYDSHGRKLYYKDELYEEYDINDNLIYRKQGNDEEWNDYDSKSRKFHTKKRNILNYRYIILSFRTKTHKPDGPQRIL